LRYIALSPDAAKTLSSRLWKAEVARMTDFTWVFVALGTIVAVPMITTLLIVRAVYKRMRGNRRLGRAALRTRAQLSTGQRRKVLRMRLQLDEILDSGQAAVDLAAQTDGPRSELPRLFRRIQTEGAALESQLRLMESETDAGVLAEQIPAVRHRVELVAGSVRRHRTAVASGLGGLSDDRLTSLGSEVEREVTALKAGLHELHSLNRRDEHFETTPQFSPSRLDRAS
jgi:hypothetical protein